MDEPDFSNTARPAPVSSQPQEDAPLKADDGECNEIVSVSDTKPADFRHEDIGCGTDLRDSSEVVTRRLSDILADNQNTAAAVAAAAAADSVPPELPLTFDITSEDVTSLTPRKPDLPDLFDEKRQQRILQLEQKISAARSLASEAGDQLAADYERELQTLRECQLEQLENVQIAIKDDLIKDNMVKYVEMTREMELKHHAEVEQLRSGYEEQIALLRRQLEGKGASNLPAIGGKSDSTTEALKAQLSMVEADHIRTTRQLKEAHHREITVLNSKINDLEFSHHMRIQELMDAHQAEIRQLQTEMSPPSRDAKAVSVAAEKIEQLIARELILKNENRQLHDKYVLEISRLHSELDQTNAEKDLLMEKIRNLEDELNKKETELNSINEQQCEEDAAKKSDVLTQQLTEARNQKLHSDNAEDSVENDEFAGRDEAMDTVAQYQQYLEAKDDIESLQDTVAVLQSEIEMLQTTLTTRDEELERLRSKIVNLESSIPVTSGSIAGERGNEMNTPEDGRDSAILQAELTEQKQVLSDMQAQFEAKIDALNKEVELQRVDVLRKEDELKKCKESINELTQKLDENRRSSTPDSELSATQRTLLHGELERVTVERDTASHASNRLVTLLTEAVRVMTDMESRVKHCLAGCDNVSSPNVPSKLPSPAQGAASSGTTAPVDHQEGSNRRSAVERSVCNSPREHKPGDDSTMTQDASSASVCSDEGCDLSQRFSEPVFSGPALDTEADDMFTDICNRLQHAIERLVEYSTEANQVIRDYQTRENNMRRELDRLEHASEELTARCDDTEQQLQHEIQTREYMSIEYYKVEGLLKGHIAEKHAADECIQSLENRIELLVRDNEHLRSLLQEFEERRDNMYQQELELTNQKAAMMMDANDKERATEQPQVADKMSIDTGLLEDNSRLNEELRAAMKQLERERTALQTELRRLEARCEELQTEMEHAADERNAAYCDYQQKIDALEKQLKSEKQFIEYQAAERELERNESLQKISHLESVIRDHSRKESINQHLSNEINDLEQLLREKTESFDGMEAAKDRADAEIKLHLNTICELRDIIRHLETDLDARCKLDRQQEQKLEEMDRELIELTETNQRLTSELSVRVNLRDDHVNLQRSICDLEEQLDSVSRSERQAQLRIKQLEEELKNLRSLEEELIQDREALQKQVCDQLQMMSSLKAKVAADQNLNAFPVSELHSIDIEDTSILQSKVAELNDVIEVRDKEVFDLNEQLTQLQERMLDQTEELQHFKAQLEAARREYVDTRAEYEDNVKLLVEERDHLQAQNDAMKRRIDTTPMSVLTQALLNEKNEEIDELKAEVGQLSAELEELRCAPKHTKLLVPTLQGDIMATSTPAAPHPVDEDDSPEAFVNYKLTVETLRDKLQQTDFELCQTQEALDKAQKQNAQWMSLNDVLIEKEAVIEQLQDQISSLMKDVDSLNEAYTSLQDDYNQVESMAKDRQRQIESAADELNALRAENASFTIQFAKLQKELQEKQNIIEEKEEELIELAEKNEKQEALAADMRRSVDQLTEDLVVKAEQLASLQNQLTLFENADDVEAGRCSHLLLRIEELQSRNADLQMLLEAEQNTSMKDGRALQTSQPPPLDDDESSISEREHRLNQAIEQNISIDNNLYNESTLTKDVSEPLATILSKLHASSLHILSLSELQFLCQLDRTSQLAVSLPDQHVEAEVQTSSTGELFDFQTIHQLWEKEKSGLRASLEAMERLQAQLNAVSTVSELPPSDANETLTDWRAGLICSVRDILAQDLTNLHTAAAVCMFASGHGGDTTGQSFSELERIINDQVAFSNSALVSLANADRLSLLAELMALRTQVATLDRQCNDTSDQMTSHPQQQDSAGSIVAETEQRVPAVSQSAVELTALLEAERKLCAETREDCQTLANKVIELKTALDQAERDHQSALSLNKQQQEDCIQLSEQLASSRLELEQTANRLRLAEEKAADAAQHVARLQAELELRRRQSDSDQQQTNNELELKIALDEERSKCEKLLAALAELRAELDRRNAADEQVIGELRSSHDIERARSLEIETQLAETLSVIDSERHQNQQLQEELDVERARSDELGKSLEHLRASSDIERARNEELSDEIAELQAALNVERAQSERLGRMLDEQQSVRIVDDKDEMLHDLRAALDVERCRGMELSAELEQIQQQQSGSERVAELLDKVEQLMLLNKNLSDELQLSANAQTKLKQECGRLQSLVDKTRAEDQAIIEKVTQRAENLEKQLRTEQELVRRLEQRPVDHADGTQSNERLKRDSTEVSLLIERKQLESARQRLCLIAMRLQDQLQLPSTSSEQMHVQSNRQHTLDEMVNQAPYTLQVVNTELDSLLTSLSNSRLAAVDAAGHSSSLSLVPELNDAILRHNAELTTYVQHAVRQRARNVESSHNQDLVRQLDLAKSEVSRLQSELLRVESELEKEHHKSISSNGDSQSNGVDRVKIHRLYSKYLRAESFRKALIYQKRYLLLLIGGFRDCEAETIALIARMGAFPSTVDARSRQMSPMSRFRSAARVVVAIARLKFVARRWHHATHGATSSARSLYGDGATIKSSQQVPPTFPSYQTVAPASTRPFVHPANYRSRDDELLSSTSRPMRSVVTIPSTPPTRDRSAPLGEHRYRDKPYDRMPVSGSAYVTAASSSSRQPAASATDSNGLMHNYLRRLEGLQAKLTESVTSGSGTNMWSSARR